MNSEKATHPAREAGQTWALDFDSIETSTNARRFTLSDRKNDVWYAEDERGHESCFASEQEFDEMPHMFRLVSPAPQVEPCAPDGYMPCSEKCGRWMHAANARCWACHFVIYKRSPYHEATVARTPDWTPPLPATPVTTGVDMAVPGSERSVHRCTGCEWFIDTTRITEAEVTRLVLRHLTEAHNANAEYRAPGPIQIKATVGGKCPLCGIAVPNGHIHACFGSKRKSASTPYPLQPEKANNRDYLDWATQQSGTSCLRDEKRPALIDRRMHFSPFDDSCLEDVR